MDFKYSVVTLRLITYVSVAYFLYAVFQYKKIAPYLIPDDSPLITLLNVNIFYQTFTTY